MIVMVGHQICPVIISLVSPAQIPQTSSALFRSNSRPLTTYVCKCVDVSLQLSVGLSSQSYLTHLRHQNSYGLKNIIEQGALIEMA